MVSIVLASHGDLAAGIKQTGSMVFGDQPSVAVVSLEPSMGPDDFRAKVEEAIASFEDQEQVLFLVDLWGGTPFNQISGLIEGHDSWAIVTGVNLPMLIEAYSQRFDAKNTAHAIATHLVTEAKAGVRIKPESLEPEEKKHQDRPRPYRHPSASWSGGHHVDQADQPQPHHRGFRRRCPRRAPKDHDRAGCPSGSPCQRRAH